MRKGTALKYLAIQKRFNELHNDKRIRYDDCLLVLMKEFYIQHSGTIQRILCTNIVVPTEQLEMFSN